MTDTNSLPAGGIMPIPGQIDPMPVPRPTLVEGVTPREDGRIDLLGLPRKRIAELFETAGRPRAVCPILLLPTHTQTRIRNNGGGVTMPRLG